MATGVLSRSDLYKRAQLISLGYGQSEKPALDVLAEVPSGAWVSGEVDLSPIAPGSATPAGLRLRGYYPPTGELFDVSDRIQSLTWNEAAGQAAVQGNLSLNNADGSAAVYMNRPGMILTLETRHAPNMPYSERYRWIAWTTNVTDLNQAALTISFYDVLIYLQTAEVSVGYVKDKAHPKGWRCDEIATDLFRRFRIPVGSIARGHYFIPTFLLQDSTIYDVIAQAYSIEHHHRPSENFFIVADRGLVYVTTNRRVLPGSKRFVISDDAVNVRQADFTRTLDQFAGGIIPSGGDANLLEGNQKGANDGYAKFPGGRQERALLTKGTQSPGEKALAGQMFPVDPLTSTNPGATQNPRLGPSKNQQRVNQELAATLLFGAITYKIGSDQIPHVNDPAYSRLAAQLLADALSSAQKKLHAVIDGNILLRVGDIVYNHITFQSGRPFRKQLFISSISHSIQNGDYMQDVIMAWRESEVSVLEDFSSVTSNALSLAQSQKLPPLPGLGSPKGSGPRWHVVASAESLGGNGACRAIQPHGYSELSTTPHGSSSDFSALGDLPCLTPMVISNPGNGKSVTEVKQDKGAGSSFLPVMGLYPATLSALGLPPDSEYHVVIQRADGGNLKPVRGSPA
jgi:hypothetical protein